MVSSKKAYRLLHDKLIRSYAMDAILSPDIKRSGKDVTKVAKDFLD